MSFDRLQREILAEMGYTVYRLQSGDADAAAADDRSPAATPRVAGAGPDPLLRALLRAAGRDARDAEALALCRGLLPPGGLHDPRARRALWPRLRALRARPGR